MAVTGIVMLDRRISLQSWLEEYKYNEEVRVRIEDYMCRNNFAMPILEYRPTNVLSLKSIQENVHGFIVPQMYYNLEPGTELFEYLERNICIKGKRIVNSFDEKIEDNICKKMT